MHVKFRLLKSVEIVASYFQIHKGGGNETRRKSTQSLGKRARKKRWNKGTEEKDKEIENNKEEKFLIQSEKNARKEEKRWGVLGQVRST